MNAKIRKRLSLFALVLTLISITATGQIPDLVQTDGIVHPLHKANIGRIIFMDGNIPLDQLKETDFLTSFALKPASDLNIRVFLGNSHIIVPEMVAAKYSSLKTCPLPL